MTELGQGQGARAQAGKGRGAHCRCAGWDPLRHSIGRHSPAHASQARSLPGPHGQAPPTSHSPSPSPSPSPARQPAAAPSPLASRPSLRRPSSAHRARARGSSLAPPARGRPIRALLPHRTFATECACQTLADSALPQEEPLPASPRHTRGPPVPSRPSDSRHGAPVAPHARTHAHIHFGSALFSAGALRRASDRHRASTRAAGGSLLSSCRPRDAPFRAEDPLAFVRQAATRAGPSSLEPDHNKAATIPRQPARARCPASTIVIHRACRTRRLSPVHVAHGRQRLTLSNVPNGISMTYSLNLVVGPRSTNLRAPGPADEKHRRRST
ncbi:hypothetical protein DAEQUDRAFT_519292 [Daedalea quercina L-15889]|uniref:Uncharacterized protein n=1 Tax=Daedalea quercina L-15889 TaxID=1314783 RepID=A0A165MEE4_9APHY|nr:hypothetical protein DAEQUDRAFT_519292 [Daedalea quercina L-15889]